MKAVSQRDQYLTFTKLDSVCMQLRSSLRLANEVGSKKTSAAIREALISAQYARQQAYRTFKKNEEETQTQKTGYYWFPKVSKSYE